jgi:type IV pilus assembly protein PilV
MIFSHEIRKRMHHAGGFSLMEVLVAVFVLALGVIGVAGMQLAAVRTTQQSRFQSNAIQIASEMADKMRANAGQMKLADGDNPFLSVSYASTGDTAPGAPDKQCYAAKCSASELASFDIYDLQKRVKALLPSGRVAVCRDSAPWDADAGAFKWNCDANDKGPVVIKLGWQEKTPDGALVNPDQQMRPGVVLTVLPYVQ